MNPSTNRRPLIITSIIGLILIGGVIWFAAGGFRGTKPSPSPSPSQTTPAYSGTELLLARGATTDQVEDFKFAVYKYLKSAKRGASQAQIKNVQHFHDPTSLTTLDTLVFDLAFDQQPPYEAHLEYNDLVSARLVLSNPQTHAQLYDSGLVKVSSED